MQTIGICRFSYPAQGGFQIEHSSIKERCEFLYHPARMDERFRFFETICLPGLKRRLRNGVFVASRFEQTCFPVRCDFSGRIGVVGLRYAIAGVCLFKVILFAALSKFCEMAAMTICAWVLASPKYRARCNPKSRFIVPKHCSTRKRCLEISLLKALLRLAQ